MNYKGITAIFIIGILFLATIGTLATFQHNAIKIGDGKDIDLNNNAVRNGFIADINCTGNCTNFATNMSATGNTTHIDFAGKTVTNGKAINLVCTSNCTGYTASGATSVSGTYVGNDQPARAINYTLPTKLRQVFIMGSDGQKISYTDQSLTNLNTYAIATPANATYFFVGLATVYPQTANSNGVTYYWVAIT